MATPASAVVHVMTGMTVYEKSSKLIEFRDVRRTAEKAMVLLKYRVNMDGESLAAVLPLLRIQDEMEATRCSDQRSLRSANTTYTIPMLKIANKPTL